ncbi:MAG: FxDxF family PEP-CTERM protein [Hyphomicrobiaceae bacterium]|nr:FxDxF family PEP-CTERM protein [Hyphomicrobiaceae bacterium]
MRSGIHTNFPVSIRKSFLTLALSMSLTAPAVGKMLLTDDFSGTSLDPLWTVQRGFANVANGFVSLHGSSPGTRDSNIQTAVNDQSWTDYHLSTRFIADGGGDNWYNAFIHFRIQELEPTTWYDGQYYFLLIGTSLWPNGPSWLLGKYDGFTRTHLVEGSIDPSVPINDRDNQLDLWANGNEFMVSINGHSLTDNPIVDNSSNPYLYGGIGIGAVWESTTRYDYVNVAAIPEPETYAMLLAGLGLIGFMARRRKESAV